MAGARLLATVAVTLALGVPHPLLAALVVMPVLDLAGIVPITPGGVGIATGAVAMALASRGISASQALGVGIAMQGVETLVSLVVGGLGTLYLIRPNDGVSSTLDPRLPRRPVFPPSPVATTVIQSWPLRRSSMVAPKMMFVSSVAAARTASAASFTS